MRYGFAAAAALRYGLGLLRLAVPMIASESRYPVLEQMLGRSIVEVVEGLAEIFESVLDLGDEAPALHRALG